MCGYHLLHATICQTSCTVLGLKRATALGLTTRVLLYACSAGEVGLRRISSSRWRKKPSSAATNTPVLLHTTRTSSTFDTRAMSPANSCGGLEVIHVAGGGGKRGARVACLEAQLPEPTKVIRTEVR